MNEPDYDSDLSDFDKQFFSSSGRFNINQVKSSLQFYNSSKPSNTSSNAQKNYTQYSSLKLSKKTPANTVKRKEVDFNKIGNRT
jgi:hypothetical protein